MSGLTDALAGYLGEDALARIRAVRVGLAGAGGLGSNCAQYLVRCGFCRLRLVDFDVVEAANLNRQFYFAAQTGQKKVAALTENLLRIEPELSVEALAERITPENVLELFGDLDVVVEALDQTRAKILVVESLLGRVGCLVAASGLAGWGDPDALTVRRVRPDFYLVGDETSAVQPGRPPLAPRVNVAAAKEADAVLSWVLAGKGT
ncbi:MAG: sulfur carrier protein ThiS adenylyltransferase ThiF [Peptococcaceae bacterium]|jgi:sulfur carrier protein ThiS adenylyltransferase|nr:sulfur carrier protein ThiS adenylyltransferase ThiF [Peptococcaceae bacterium]